MDPEFTFAQYQERPKMILYPAIDLNDGNVMGGTEDALSIALNWYPNRSVRIMADWSRVLDTDESNTVRMFAQDMDIFTLRTQWNF